MLQYIFVSVRFEILVLVGGSNLHVKAAEDFEFTLNTIFAHNNDVTHSSFARSVYTVPIQSLRIL